MRRALTLLCTLAQLGGAFYYLGLVGLLAGAEPFDGAGAGGALAHPMALPGGRWFLHAAAATLIVFIASVVKHDINRRE